MQFRVLMTLAASASFMAAGTLQDADKEMYAARYQRAAELYRKILEADPTESRAYYGLVRSLLSDRRSQEAYRAAEEGLRKNAQTPGVQTAAGLAAYRSGDVAKAQECFRAALRLDSGYAGALQGMASINDLVSRFKTARDLVLQAYRNAPGDPKLMLEHANTLKGAEHIAALGEVLALLDPGSGEAQDLRAHIADDRAAGDRKLRRLVSPYEKTKVKLIQIVEGPSADRGVGLRVQINEHQNLRLLLDTGASGLSVSPKSAERAGLEILGDKSTEAEGIGDKTAQASYRYLASQVRIGSVVFADYPISVFRSAKTPDFDGLIGADVFRDFLVTVDFPKLELVLEPRAASPSSDFYERDAAAPAPGFQRVFRFGNHLAIPTLINDGKSTLFLIDSGSTVNMLDTEIGRRSAGMSRDDEVGVEGIQGRVNQTSRARRVTLVFAGFRQDNPSLVAISLEKMSDAMGVACGGILGWPVLSQMALTIDYQEGTVHFEYFRKRKE